MPSNKQQHFIPQFYLKNFSRDPSRKSINLLNLRRKKIILQASIRMQCYQDYFYGKDNDFEARLGELESYTGAVLRAVIMNDSVSNKPGVRMLLATYLAVQYQRTLAAEHDTNELFERMLRLIYRGRPDEDEMERFRIAIANTPLLNTVSAIRVSPILYDLTTVILLNRSSVDFVTSDHPVVLMNKFWKSRFAGAGANLAAAGLLIFLPLSPRHALLMYDSSVYFLERDARNALTIKKQKDIDKINELQLLRALHNVYFAHASQGEAIMRQFEEVANRRRDSYVEVDEFVEAASPGSFVRQRRSNEASATRRSLVLGSRAGIDAELRLSFLRLRAEPRYQYDGSAAGAQRDPAWTRIVMDFSKGLENRTVRFDELRTFGECHTLWPAVGRWKNKAL